MVQNLLFPARRDPRSRNQRRGPMIPDKQAWC